MEDLVTNIEQEEELSYAARGEVYETLRKVLSNIVKNPTEPKFRTLKKENKVVSEKLCRSHNAISCLLALGFDDNGVAYVCPEDVDLGLIQECSELLECIITSRAPQDGDEAAPAAAAAAAAAPRPLSGAPAPKAVSASSKAFARRSDEDKKREEQQQQLEAVRRERELNRGNAPAVATPAVATESPKPQAAAAAAAVEPDAKKKPVKSAFDFISRSAQEQKKAAADESLEAMRAAQKAKFKEFQNDPNAKQQEAYKAPPSIAPGGKESSNWGSWLGGMFGGGSSSSGSGGGGGGNNKGDRPGPKIKGISDLPKPVQKG